jgi:hypothetical protein
MEILFVFGAAVFVFLLFFLVFAIRQREKGEPVRIHNCQNCGCEKKETGHLERFRQQAVDDGQTTANAKVFLCRSKNADHP